MKVYSEVAQGALTVFPCPASPATKFAKVANVLTALTAQSENSVTFAVAPAAGVAVDIFYGPDIVVPPATYTASGFAGAIPPPALANGLTLFLNCTAVSGTTPTLTVRLQVLDQVSNAWMDVPGASFIAITVPGTATLTLFPGAASTPNVSVNQTIRNIFRAAWTIGGTTPSFTFSVGAQA
jgi:hypothetical protein